MSNYYVFQKLEELLNELNPTIVPNPLSMEKVASIIAEIIIEKQNIKNSLLDLFYRNNENESTIQLIRKSHHSLVVLINKSYETRNNEMSVKMNVISPLDQVLHCLDQIWHWFNQNFNGYINDEQPQPITRLKVIRGLIIERMDAIINILTAAGNTGESISVVTHALEEFVRRIDCGEAISRHEVIYHKDLIKDIERENGLISITPKRPSLDELLIYWNLNSKEALTYFTKKLHDQIGTFKTIHERLDYLQGQYKMVNQIPELPNFKYDPRNPGMKEYFCSYILKEIEYPSRKQSDPEVSPKNEFDEKLAGEKVICNLSVDQLSLILRALYDLKIISAKSMSLFFKFMVRYLATPYTDHISWENMRRKSYSGEPKDVKHSVDLALEVAKKIREY